MTSEQKIHGKSTWTTNCPIFHKCFAFKLGTSQLVSLHRYTKLVSMQLKPNCRKNLIAADQAQFKLWKPAQSLQTWKHTSRILSVVFQLQNLLKDLKDTDHSCLLRGSEDTSCPAAWSEWVPTSIRSLHLFSAVPVWLWLLLADPVLLLQPETKPRHRPVSPHLTPNCNKLFSSHSQPVQNHSSQDTSVADYKLPYYIHLLPLDVSRQTLNVSVWGRVYLLGGLGLGEGCIAWAPSGKEWGISGKIIDELDLLLSSSNSPWKIHLNGYEGGRWWVPCPFNHPESSRELKEGNKL